MATEADQKVADEICKAVGAIYDVTPAYEIITRHRTASTAALTAEVVSLKAELEMCTESALRYMDLYGQATVELARVEPLEAEIQRLREEAAGALADYDATVKACPANMQFLADKLCPKCNAGPDEGCRREIIAAGDVIRRVRAALSTTSEVSEPVAEREKGDGWVYWNPDSGEEYSPQHPIKSGECHDAERIRHSTPQEDTLWQAFQEQFHRAEALTKRASEPVADETARDDMLRTARELRENANGDCNAIKQAMMWEEKANAVATPPNPAGDAVREALAQEITKHLAEWTNGNPEDDCLEHHLLRRAAATLAKHGGEQ